MPQPFKKAVLTNAGANIISRAKAGDGKIQFTRIVTGNGSYSEAEKDMSLLQAMSELKSAKNTFNPSSITRVDDTCVRISVLITNMDPRTKEAVITEAYYINEIGLYAKIEGDKSDVLYSVTVSVGEKGDLIPAYNGESPAQINQAWDTKVSSDAEIAFQLPAGAVAMASDLEGKVDKEDGKGLSSNDFTDEYKKKIADLLKMISDESEGKILTNSATMRTLLVDVIEKNIKTTQGANAIQIKNNVSCNQTIAANELMADGKKFTDISKSVKTLEDIIERSGIGDKLLGDKQINDSYTFQNLIAESVITFFTNWTDNTNFPQIYGSGVLIPCLDDNAKVILYGDIMAGDLYLILSLDAGKRIVTRRLAYEGRKTGAGRGKSSNAFGENNAASETCAFAAGWNCDAIGEYSAALGNSNVASGNSSAALGNTTKATGVCSFSTGHSTNAVGNDSAAFGLGTTAQHTQLVMGYYTNQATSTHDGKCGKGTNTILCISNGGNSNDCSNAVRVNANGQIYASNSSITTGADYAEFFEWSDGNPDGEDRVGRFVTFDINKPEMIKYANTGDYLLGIVSGMPSVIGNGDEEWRKRYVLDDFGRYIEEEELVERELPDPETGESVKSMEKVIRWKENPEYDNTKDYIPRDRRSEWAAIGMLGVLNVYDDGSCKVNGYCQCGLNGIATPSDTGYRVIRRVAENIIKIVFR